MNKAENYFEEKGIDISQIVCYCVPDGVEEVIDFDPIEFAADFAENECKDFGNYMNKMFHGIVEIHVENFYQTFKDDTKETS